MALRLLISDALWSKIEPVLRELKHAAGSPPALSDRMFIEAVLYQARTGTPWRDLPDEFGNWNAVYHRFRRWEKRDLWKRLWQRFQTLDDERLGTLFIDSTIVRAHQHAAGASKKRGLYTCLPGRMIHAAGATNSCAGSSKSAIALSFAPNSGATNTARADRVDSMPIPPLSARENRRG